MKQLKKHIINCTTILALVLCSTSMELMSKTDSGQQNYQYLLPEFTQSIVKMKTGESRNIIMNYNTVTEKMVFQQNGKLMDMTNLGAVDTVFLGNRKFVLFDKAFYELLVDAPISLFIQYKSDLLSPGRPAAYGGTSQVSSSVYAGGVELSSGYYNLKLPSDYVVKPEPVNWIRKNNTMSKFLNERQFLKIFPENADKLKQFIKQNKISTYNPADLIKLINYCNELNR
jgi:hypothetical protein